MGKLLSKEERDRIDDRRFLIWEIYDFADPDKPWPDGEEDRQEFLRLDALLDRDSELRREREKKRREKRLAAGKEWDESAKRKKEEEEARRLAELREYYNRPPLDEWDW